MLARTMLSACLIGALGCATTSASQTSTAPGATTAREDRVAGSVQGDDCRGERSYARLTDFPANLTAPPLIAMFRFEQPGESAASGRVLVRR